MATFRFVARDGKGAVRKGYAQAETVSSLVRGLREQGLLVTSASPVEPERGSFASRLKSITIIKPKVKHKDLILFTRQFAMMLEAGIDIVTSLSILEEQTDHVTLKEVIGRIREEVEKGKSLADAMREHPRVFDRFYISMVEAAQTSGSYEKALLDIAADLERKEKIKNRVKTAIMPSLMTLGFAVLLCFGLIKFVVPQFVDLYAGISELPKPTQLLLALSGMMQGIWGLAIFAGMAVLAFGFKKLISTETGRRVWDELKFKMPLFGPLIRKIAIAHFARTLGLLLKNAVDYLLSLEIVAAASKNVILAEVLNRAKDEVNRGMPLSKPLAESGIFPPMVIQMISSGEEAAKLPEMLEKISEIYEEEIDRAIERLSGLLTPILTLIVGVIVGGLLLGLYMPIFHLGEVLLKQP
ncbi:hypothetical protein DRP77_07900 [Candidatus Poribacteria bacterium]|nr:MAG: hypothetical protein DRP77_07900 [Candidatus Poribacteria bacterium]